MPNANPETFKIAAVPATPVFLNCHATVEKACELNREVGSSGASLAVFLEASGHLSVLPSIWVALFLIVTGAGCTADRQPDDQPQGSQETKIATPAETSVPFSTPPAETADLDLNPALITLTDVARPSLIAPTAPASTGRMDTAGWETYRDDSVGFEF